jgi:hypothetical protein
MRWLPWALGIIGVLQFGIMAVVKPDSSYVTLDTAYLVMWLAVIGGVVACYLSCWGGCGYGGCDCDHCGGCSSGECCGNCGCYGGNVEMKGGMGHEGHSHEGHEGHQH